MGLKVTVKFKGIFWVYRYYHVTPDISINFNARFDNTVIKHTCWFRIGSFYVNRDISMEWPWYDHWGEGGCHSIQKLLFLSPHKHVVFHTTVTSQIKDDGNYYYMEVTSDSIINGLPVFFIEPPIYLSPMGMGVEREASNEFLSVDVIHWAGPYDYVYSVS